MQIGRMVRGPWYLPLLLVAVGALLGCSGDWCEDDYCRDDRDDWSYQKTLFIYLNVADQDGEPLEGATVWVDGSQMQERTAADYRQLGSQFPPDWRGWNYNWSGGPYWIDLRDCSNRRCTIEILVSKTGYETQRTTITLTRYDPNEIYMRQTFVMEQRVGAAAADGVVDAPQAAELISLTRPDWRR